MCRHVQSVVLDAVDTVVVRVYVPLVLLWRAAHLIHINATPHAQVAFPHQNILHIHERSTDITTGLQILCISLQKPVPHLKRAATPCIDYHLLTKDKLETVGDFAPFCAQMF